MGVLPNQIKMSTKQNKREVLAAVLSGKIAPKDIPGEGCLTITPGANGLVDVDGQLMNEKQAKRAIAKAETILFFEGDDGTNDLFNELSANPDFEIDFNDNDNDLNEIDHE